MESGDDHRFVDAVRLQRIKLAIEQVEPFKRLYEQFSNNRLPAPSVLRDFLIENSLAPPDHVDECVETFLANARDLGLVTTYAGAERMLRAPG